MLDRTTSLKPLTFLSLILSGGASFGCASAGASPEPKSPNQIEVPTTIVSPEGVENVEELLARADREFSLDHFEEAARLYERVVEYDLSGKYHGRGLLGAGESLDRAGEPERALANYERFLGAIPASPERETIEVRVVRLLTYLERYEQAETRARGISLDRRAPLERVAILAARAHGALVRGQVSDAERDISQGRGILEGLGVAHVETLPLDGAALFLALGELRRFQAGEVRFDPFPADFGQELERRCQLLLDAQSAYSETMKAKNAHYSAMAGVRVGQLYQELHDELMRMPAPAAANTQEKRALVEGALRLRYSILLDKAAKMLEHTLAMLERTEDPSPWAVRARASLQALQESRAAEQAALDALPYSRAQLEAALEDLEKRAQGGASR